MKFMSRNNALLGIQEIVGPKGWSSEKTVTINHSTETRGMWQGHCDLVVNPAIPKEVSDIVKSALNTPSLSWHREAIQD